MQVCGDEFSGGECQTLNCCVSLQQKSLLVSARYVYSQQGFGCGRGSLSGVENTKGVAGLASPFLGANGDVGEQVPASIGLHSGEDIVDAVSIFTGTTEGYSLI